MWHTIISSLVGINGGQKLRIVRTNSQTPSHINRDLMYTLLSDYLVQMTQMDMKLHNKKFAVVEKMYKMYGEKLVTLWKQVKVCSEFKQLRGTSGSMIRNVQRYIKHWNTSTQTTRELMIIKLAWDRYKSYIIQYIIEPYLQMRCPMSNKKKQLERYNKQQQSTPPVVKNKDTLKLKLVKNKNTLKRREDTLKLKLVKNKDTLKRKHMDDNDDAIKRRHENNAKEFLRDYIPWC